MNDKVESALWDELSKIAGEMQGFTRIGRKPISIERMLEREAEVTGLPENLLEAGDAAGRAIAKMAGISGKSLALLGAGGAAYHVGRKAELDRRSGRAMRRQQQLAMQQAALGGGGY